MTSKVEIVVEAKDRASPTLGKVGSGVSGITSAAKSFVSIAGSYISAVTTVITAVLKLAGISAEAETVHTRLNATLMSTGRQSEITAKQIEEMSSALMRGSVFDDEAITNATNALLKFTSISTSNLPAITSVAIDMASALGTDVVSAADSLGVALEAGLIPRTWGFSKALKDQIRTAVDAGDEGKALSLIMGELTNRFGGQGLAALTTYTGATSALKNEMGNLAEIGGNQVLPVLTALKFAFSDVLVIAQDTALGMEDAGSALENLKTDELNDALKKTNEELQKAESYTDKYMLSQRLLGIQEELSRRSTQDLAFDVGTLGSAYNNLKLEIADIPEAVDLSGLYKDVTDIQSAYDKWKSAVEDSDLAIAQANEQLASGEITQEEYAQKIKDMAAAYNEAKAANERWMKQFILSAVQMKMAEGGLTGEEFKQLLLIGEKLGLIDPEVAAATQNVMDAINGTDPAGLDQALADMEKLFSYDGKEINVNVNTTTTTTTTTDTGDGEDTADDEYAGGGSFNVPAGYPNDSYRLGVSSGEHVEVTTPAQQMMGEATSVYNYYIDRATFLLQRGAEGEILASLTE